MAAQTHIKTPKIYSMASIVEEKGYGKLLLLEISKFVTTKCGCKFMTVVVARCSRGLGMDCQDWLRADEDVR